MILTIFAKMKVFGSRWWLAIVLSRVVFSKGKIEQSWRWPDQWWMRRIYQKTFWVEAIKSAVYILNRCQTKVGKNMIPFEAWSSIKPSVKHFKIFGCVGYAHFPLEKYQNLMRSVKNAFLLVIVMTQNRTDYLMLRLTN